MIKFNFSLDLLLIDFAKILLCDPNNKLVFSVYGCNPWKNVVWGESITEKLHSSFLGTLHYKNDKFTYFLVYPLDESRIYILEPYYDRNNKLLYFFLIEEKHI